MMFSLFTLTLMKLQIADEYLYFQVSHMIQNKVPKQSRLAVEEQAANKQRRKPRSLLDQIQPIDFHGKKISCLVKEETNQQFALIEAISRVYFPQCSLDEFINAIANVLQISIYQLNRDEEKAFITFYGLPTESLKCSKVLNLHELDQFMPQMKYMFRDREQPHLEASQNQEVPASTRAGLVDPAAQTSNPDTSSMNFSSTILPPPNPFKKSATLPKRGASKLEDAVNRLRQNKMLELGGSSPSSSNSSNSEMMQSAPIPPRNPFETKESSPVSSLPSVAQIQ